MGILSSAALSWSFRCLVSRNEGNWLIHKETYPSLLWDWDLMTLFSQPTQEKNHEQVFALLIQNFTVLLINFLKFPFLSLSSLSFLHLFPPFFSFLCIFSCLLSLPPFFPPSFTNNLIKKYIEFFLFYRSGDIKTLGYSFFTSESSHGRLVRRGLCGLHMNTCLPKCLRMAEVEGIWAPEQRLFGEKCLSSN